MHKKLSGLLSLAFVSALVSPFAFAGDPKTDLTMRRAIYVARNKAAIDLMNDKYVAAGETITLNRRQAESCQDNKCTFNLGIIAIKSGGAAALTTYGQYTGKNGIAGNSIVFKDSETTKQLVLPVKLSIGKNVITFTIDPQNKIAESDETNNSMTVTLVVE